VVPEHIVVCDSILRRARMASSPNLGDAYRCHTTRLRIGDHENEDASANEPLLPTIQQSD